MTTDTDKAMNSEQVNRVDHRQHDLEMAKLRDTAAVLTKQLKRHQHTERATRDALIQAATKANRAIDDWTKAAEALTTACSDAEAHNSAVLDQYRNNPLLQGIKPGAEQVVRIDQGVVDTLKKGWLSMTQMWR
jgi:hypothetical protein